MNCPYKIGDEVEFWDSFYRVWEPGVITGPSGRSQFSDILFEFHAFNENANNNWTGFTRWDKTHDLFLRPLTKLAKALK